MSIKNEVVKTIKLDDEIHNRLARYGTRVGETFQDVIIRLMDFWDSEHEREREHGHTKK